MLYWISWYQPTDDHRPMTFPPNNGVLGWWCTGSRDSSMNPSSDEPCDSTLCALVIAENKIQAEEIVRVDWPEAEEWRFCEKVESTKLSNRFQLNDWMIPRIDVYNGEHLDASS